MKFIINIINHFTLKMRNGNVTFPSFTPTKWAVLMRKGVKQLMPKDLPKPVGRWRIENCNKQLNHKVDLSNEDHCGPCGQYALEKIELTNNKNKNIHLEKVR